MNKLTNTENQVLTLQGLCKKYEHFELKDVSFSIAEGKITGFIGRNGAGKTTTLKSLLNLVHPDSGEIRFWNMDFKDNEFAIKQKIGFAAGGISYYPKKKLSLITDVSRRFYAEWDDKAYRQYMQMFQLEEDKTPAQLSEGMKVKYALTLALSHNARLLILDEPTSGLDPVSRDDLLDVFLDLVDKTNISILFSTHITSDLDKCADNIVYIQNGRIINESSLDTFIGEYKAVAMNTEELTAETEPFLIGCKRNRNGYDAIVKTQDADKVNGKISQADLEQIMIHLEKED